MVFIKGRHMRRRAFVDSELQAKEKTDLACEGFQSNQEGSYVDFVLEESLAQAKQTNLHLDKIERMIEKAALSLDFTDTSCAIICHNHECIKKEDCFRYAIYSYLMQKQIYEYVYPLLKNQFCTCFLKNEQG